MNIRCETLEDYQALNAQLSGEKNYDSEAVRNETGTERYSTETPQPVYIDENEIVYQEQNAEGTLSEVYMMPLTSGMATVLMMMRGKRVYDDNFNFVFKS